MANKKISELELLELVTGSEEIAVVSGGKNYKITADMLKGETGEINGDCVFELTEDGGIRPKGSEMQVAEKSFTENIDCSCLYYNSHAEGYQTYTTAPYAHAEGYQTTAYYNAHAEGYQTMANGNNSHAEGTNTTANGWYSHAEGVNTSAGYNAHAEGYSTIADQYSHAEGYETTAMKYGHAEGGWTYVSSDAHYGHAEGRNTSVFSEAGHAEGMFTQARGNASHAEGSYTYAAGTGAHAEGINTTANGEGSHAEGKNTKALGQSSHAEGEGNYACGMYSHAEGKDTSANNYAHSEGLQTIAKGEYSHAEGNYNFANGQNSHAEGNRTNANGSSSHTEGYSTTADGNSAHAEGYCTKATHAYEHASGIYNDSSVSENEDDVSILFTVGNGTRDSSRHNALQIMHDGTIYIPDIYAEGEYYEKPMIKLQDALSNNGGGGTNATPDWLAEEGQDGYIKNSPLVSKKAIEIASFSEKTLSSSGNYKTYNSIQTSESIVGNVRYTVIFDNNEYVCFAQTNPKSGWIEITNGKIDDETGNPGALIDPQEGEFLLSFSPSSFNSGTLYVYDPDDKLDTITTHNFALYRGVNATVIDSKYLQIENSLGDSEIALISQRGITTALEKITSPFTKGQGENSAVLYTTNAASDYSVAEGLGTTASGQYSHAEGQNTTASGQYSHAEGLRTTASGWYSHAEGCETTAGGKDSHAEGLSTTASNSYEHASGYYNNCLNDGKNDTAFGSPEYTLFTVGNGVNDMIRQPNGSMARISQKHNALQIMQNGDIYIPNTNAEGEYYEKPMIKLQDFSAFKLQRCSDTSVGIVSVLNTMPQINIGNGAFILGSGTSAPGDNSFSSGQGSTAAGRCAHAEGSGASARANFSHAEGAGTIVNGEAAHAEGGGSYADGRYSHAEGSGTHANGEAAHTEGWGSYANGQYSHAEGYYAKTTNLAEHASGHYNNSIENSSDFGNAENTLFTVGNGKDDDNRHNALQIMQDGTIYVSDIYDSKSYDKKPMLKLQDIAAFKLYRSSDSSVGIVSAKNTRPQINMGDGALSVGNGTIASGDFSFAGGSGSTASGQYSVAWGSGSTASNQYSVIFGGGRSTGQYSFATGISVSATGDYSFASGNSTLASGNNSHAEGNCTQSEGYASHSEGYSTTASDEASHAEGYQTHATNKASHAEGYSTKAEAEAAHAEGYDSTASGLYSHAEGYVTTASEHSSHAEGYGTKAQGDYSHAEGNNTEANGLTSHAEGNHTIASGQYSHAEGSNTEAKGRLSHTEGYYTVAENTYEHASGYYNKSLITDEQNIGNFGNAENTLFSVGNGSGNDNRHNAFEIRQNGDIYISDTAAEGAYYEKPMIKLQDALKNISNSSSSSETLSPSGKTTSISEIPSDKNLVIVNISESGTLGFASDLQDGRQINIIVNNTGDEEITITIPEEYKSNGKTELIVEEGCFAKLYVACDGENTYVFHHVCFI